jgi:hypothetical protein
MDQLAYEASRNPDNFQSLGKDPPAGVSLSPTLMAIQPRSVPGPCRTIFGYLPYWESAANIRWNLLTHLACFSVDLSTAGDGSIANLRGWPSSWNSTITAAHQNGVKVILVATLFNNTGISTLMGNATYKNTFFTNMKTQVLAGGADGINLDFEGTGSWRNTFHTFLSEFTTYMHTEVPGCEVSFAGPALTSGLSTSSVAAACDYIFIMGYAYYGSFSSTTGANSPYNSMVNVLDTQWGSVKNSTPQKLILGLPYYGNHWTTGTSNAAHASATFVSSTRFRDDATDAFTPGYELLWDSASQTPWYRYLVSTTWHQVWFDNATSLGLKFSLADARNLGGVGMWALNYDGTRYELWDELNKHYGKPCQGPILPDFDGDGDVDMVDFGKFQACTQGPTIAAKLPDCWKAMLDTDTDVDIDDYAKFEPCLSGADHPASISCLN